MLERSTEEIITICRKAIPDYEKAVKKTTFLFGLMGRPGDGYREYKILLEKIKNYQPNEAVFEVYNFYMGQDFSSRLRIFVQHALFEIFEIDYNIELDMYGMPAGGVWPGDVLDMKMMHIKHELGISDEEDALLPSVPIYNGF